MIKKNIQMKKKKKFNINLKKKIIRFLIDKNPKIGSQLSPSKFLN